MVCRQHVMHLILWDTESLCCCTSEAQLEVQNGEVEVRWYLSSFAPPYVKVLLHPPPPPFIISFFCKLLFCSS